ncbi:hypothetical protein [Streptoalloteichus hindustanus]|uniref:Uncharacterized protein n=1 Tax=Streptoalloteichus hindustanus TaxID=2017 RepID=A0A1M5EWP4_STRHI|nr:hypothetical protein [Streptoalloteichus hindustanus]SHF83607.1 hypothetical protein SAMN05444320_105171 [Streptoalloteichus hindustanus]
MPPRKKVPPQKKQSLKQKVAKTADDARKAAAAVAAAAAATAATATAAGEPALAAAAGAVSGVAGLVALFSTIVQKLANDPPRDDFDEVWVSSAALDENALPTEEPQRTIVLFSVQHAILADNFYALVRALERHDGALEAGNDDAADAQADAAQQNADAITASHQALQDLAFPINGAWTAATAVVPPDFGSLTVEDMRQHFLANWGDPPENPAESPSDSLSAVLAALTGAADDLLQPFDVGLPDPILGADEVPGEPAELIGGDYLSSLADAVAELPGLVVEEE